MTDCLHLTGHPPGVKENPLAGIEEAMAGLRQYHIVMTAFELGVPDVFLVPGTPADLAEKTGCHPGLAPLLCEGLVPLGILKKEGDNYRSTEYARAHFTKDASYPLRNTLRFQRMLGDLWTRFPEILKTGPVMFDREEMFRNLIIPSMADQCRCGLLQKITGYMTAIPEFHEARRLLDLGGGHGLYSIAFCKQNPGLEAVVFDLPQVTAATEDFIREYHATRVHTQPGDFFRDPIGEGYDIVFSSSNPGGKVPSLIPKIADSLNEGGLYINKQGMDSAPTDPLSDLEWNLWTFHGIQKSPVRYTFENSVPLSEYNNRLKDHGFVIRDIIPVDFQSAMTISKKVS